MLHYFNPLAWARWFGQFVSAWILSTPWREAPKAIPALILLIGLTVTGAIAVSDGSGWRARRVEGQLARAAEVDDYETAELVLRRQIQADPDDTDLRFRLAVVRDDQGESEEASGMMRELVRARKHEAAAKWLLRTAYDDRNWSDLSEAERNEYGGLLELLHDGSSEDPTIKRLLAGYYLDTSRPAKAVPLLVELSGRYPTLGLQAAAIQRSLGNRESSIRLAEQTLTVLQDQLREEPTNSALSIFVAQNQIFLERFDEAIRTLATAANRTSIEEESARLRQGLADTIVAYVNHIEQTPSRTPAERMRVLRMIEKALEVAPNNPRVLTLVADHMLRAGDGEDESVEQLRESLIEGASPGISHFIRGTTALMNDDIDKAVMHLEIAAELMPNSGAILNNLAVAMTSREEVELETALQLSERAIAQSPEATPHFYETRGQILLRMGKHLKAVPDLERALAVPALAPKAHEALAVCYRELGDEELSERHRQAAEEKAPPANDS